jgi:putative FmdB family regulatory protein
MPVYQFRCSEHGSFEETRPMSEASEPGICAACNREANRVFGDFLYFEDRCRFARNPRTGTNFSDVLGQEYPQDRATRNRVYAEKGIEPVSTSDMPSQWKTALDYRRHLDAGGDALADTSSLIESPDLSDVKSIAQMVRESGMTKADMGLPA